MFFQWEILNYEFNFLSGYKIGLFRLCISSWLSFGSLWRHWGGAPCFIPDIGDLCFLSFSTPSVFLEVYKFYSFFFKEPLFVSLIFLYCFPVFSFNDFYSLSFLSLCLLWVDSILFPVSWGRNFGYLSETFLFSDISTSCCIFPIHLPCARIPRILYVFICSSMEKVIFESGPKRCVWKRQRQHAPPLGSTEVLPEGDCPAGVSASELPSTLARQCEQSLVT